tara:strand:- start:302 stop:1291 length:990 start_codon:yes stop_codon:yes gene_type:complete
MRVLIIVLFFLTSCVTQQAFSDLETKKSKVEDHNKNLQIKIKSLESTNQELNEELSETKTKTHQLLAQVQDEEKKMFQLNLQLSELQSAYDILAEKNSKSIENKAKEIKKILQEINKLQNEIQKKEDKLYDLESNLNTKQKVLIEYKDKIEKREIRINELENIIKQQDSSLVVLKDNLVKSLVDFTGKGLDIKLKNGRIYILLEQDLLFQSGSWSVDTSGKLILQDLINVLANHHDMNIIIEGHTDNKPYQGSGNVKDNWDLSVMRATAIVKILTSNNKIASSRLTAAGRGEFNPISDNNTDESRSKNRRIEIILYPALDKLYDFMHSK